MIDMIVRPHHKGFPASAVGRPVGELTGLGLDDFGTPVLLLREDALAANVRGMQRFCDEAGMSLSPHVKTTLSPEVVERQLAAGAWAVTVATPTQLRTLRSLGVRRILLANQLVDPAAMAWLGAELDRDPDFEAYCYVDSPEGVALLARNLPADRPLPVLVELGVPGGRTGVRSVAGVVELAGLVAGSPPLRFAGVAGFEGTIESLDEVERFLHRLREAADRTVGDGELIVTVGGSAHVELVRDAFDARWRDGRPIRVVLRSGCYVTHDSGGYQRLRELVGARYDLLGLTPALELWARVLSRPEPDLALVDFGRRDTGTDAGYPVLLSGKGTVVAMNDQHAYLKAPPGTGPLALVVGDLVGFGISHPCTTLDKWRLVPIVDADRRLVGAARTLF